MDTSTLNPNTANIANLAKTADSDEKATDSNVLNADSANSVGSFTNSNFKDLESLSSQAIYSGSGLNKIQEGGRDIVRSDELGSISTATDSDLLPGVTDQSKGESREKAEGSTASSLDSSSDSIKQTEEQAGSADNGHPEFIKKLLLVPWISKVVDLSNNLISDHFPDGVLQKFKSAKDNKVPDDIDLNSAESVEIEADSSISDLNNTANIEEDSSTSDLISASESENDASIREVLSDTAVSTSISDEPNVNAMDLEVVDDDSADLSLEVEDGVGNQDFNGIDSNNGESPEREVGVLTQDPDAIYEAEYDSNFQENELNQTEMPLQSDNFSTGSSDPELVGNASVNGVSQKVEVIDSEQTSDGLVESNREGNQLAEDPAIPPFNHSNGQENESNIREGEWDQTGPMVQNDSSNWDPTLLPAGLGLISGGFAQGGGGGGFTRGIIDLEASKGPSRGARVDKRNKSDKKVATDNKISDGIDPSEEQSTERETDSSTANLNLGNGAKVDSNIQDEESNQDETVMPEV